MLNQNGLYYSPSPFVFKSILWEIVSKKKGEREDKEEEEEEDEEQKKKIRKSGIMLHTCNPTT